MFLKFVLLGITCLVLLLYALLTKIKLKHRLLKDLKEKKKRQETFKRKMEELEIK